MELILLSLLQCTFKQVHNKKKFLRGKLSNPPNRSYTRTDSRFYSCYNRSYLYEVRERDINIKIKNQDSPQRENCLTCWGYHCIFKKEMLCSDVVEFKHMYIYMFIQY